MQLHAPSISCHSTHVQAAFQLHSYDYLLYILLVDLYVDLVIINIRFFN